MTDRIIGSISDLAAVPGMPSDATLRKLIRENPDFPLLSAGKNGIAYEIDVEEAVAWIRRRAAAEMEAKRARGEEVRQFALTLLGDDPASDLSGPVMTSAERKQLLEEELIAMRVAERRGELVRADSVEAALSNAFVIDAKRRSTFAARLGKRVELSREQIAAIEAMMTADQHALAADLEALGRVGQPEGQCDD